MLSNQNIMAFVATTDSKRARVFYEGVLGLTVKGMSPYAIIFDANGIELRVAIVRELTPAPYTVVGWVVEDIATFVAALGAKGVLFEKYGFLEQEENGIWMSPDGAKVAWFRDPDGNTLSLAQL